MSTPRPYLPGQQDSLAEAIELLRHAREAAKKADSPRATAAIRRAIKSTEGAQRHSYRRCAYTQAAAHYASQHPAQPTELASAYPRRIQYQPHNPPATR